MDRIDIINEIINRFNYTSYVEIGVSDGDCFNQVDIKNKIGVDPDMRSKATNFVTSDEFFAKNKYKYDLFFIDGLHHSDQTYKDILNSLEVLNKGGTIVLHDVNPISENSQEVIRKTKQWNGNVWMAWIKLRNERNDLEMFCINVDMGVGIIRMGKQLTLNIQEKLNYKNLDKNREKWLNLKPPEFFMSWINKKNKNAIYTCITGGYDSLITPRIISQNFDYICFTNNKNIKHNIWNIIYIEDNFIDDIKLARKIKIMGHEILPTYDCIIWIDANFEINCDLNYLLKSSKKYDLSLMKHSLRDCIYDEAEICIKSKKDNEGIIKKQIGSYHFCNYPYKNGLAGTGILIKKNNMVTNNFMRKWWEEVNLKSHRDQLSFNYVLWKNKINIKYLDWNKFTKQKFILNLHKKSDNEHIKLNQINVKNMGYLEAIAEHIYLSVTQSKNHPRIEEIVNKVKNIDPNVIVNIEPSNNLRQQAINLKLKDKYVRVPKSGFFIVEI